MIGVAWLWLIPLVLFVLLLVYAGWLQRRRGYSSGPTAEEAHRTPDHPGNSGGL